MSTPQGNLPLEKVEAMFSAYCNRQSANHVATAEGVSWATANRYITKGDPVRGIDPFSVRFLKVASQTSQRTNRTVVYSAAARDAASHRQLQMLDSLIVQAIQRLQATIGSDAVKLPDIAKAIQVRNQVADRLAPPTTVTEQTEREVTQRSLASYSRAELQAIAEGRLDPLSGGPAAHPPSKPSPIPEHTQAPVHRQPCNRHKTAPDQRCDDCDRPACEHPKPQATADLPTDGNDLSPAGPPPPLTGIAVTTEDPPTDGQPLDVATWPGKGKQATSDQGPLSGDQGSDHARGPAEGDQGERVACTAHREAEGRTDGVSDGGRVRRGQRGAAAPPVHEPSSEAEDQGEPQDQGEAESLSDFVARLSGG